MTVNVRYIFEQQKSDKRVVLGKIRDHSYEGIGFDLISNVNYKRHTKWRRLEMTLEAQVMVRRSLHSFQRELMKSGIGSVVVGKETQASRGVKETSRTHLLTGKEFGVEMNAAGSLSSASWGNPGSLDGHGSIGKPVQGKSVTNRLSQVQ